MATVAGTVMVLYASILGPVIPDALANILIASIISAPAAITIARLMIPGEGEHTEGDMRADADARGTTMEAIVEGTTRGITLLINVTAMLVVMVALVALVNEVLGLLPDLGGAPVTLQRALAYLLWPLAWVIGIPAGEALVAAELLGTKTVINELVAYVQLAGLPEEAMSPRSRLILVYAMCGFANFGSLGIVIAGLTTMAPARRAEIVGMGLKSIVAGTLATCMTGAIVGLFNL
jgi:CNT family concentrative nucleoside transporter